MNAFVEYASLYDLFYQDKDYESEAGYLQKMIKTYKPDTKSILDLGCGTGRHALLMAKEGYEITGVDASEKMLEQAQLNISTLADEQRKLINFHCDDISRLKLGKKYDLIYSLFHVISYQTSDEALAGTFQSVKNHLDETGIFIFDVWYGPGVLKMRPENRIHEYRNGQSIIKRTAIPTLLANDNIVKIKYTIDIESENRKIVEDHHMRYFFQPELKQFLSDCGIEIVAVFDGFTDREPDENTWSATFITKNIN